MISKRSWSRLIALGLSAVLMTGCGAIMPNNYETLPVVASVESVEETETEIETETEEETETETETEESETEEENESETEAETEAETYPIDEGYTRVNQIVEVIQNVNMRKGPGTEYDAVGLLIAQSRVERISDNGEWSQIVYDGNVYYAASEFLQVVEDNVLITMAAGEAENDTEAETESTEAETETEAVADASSSLSFDEISLLSNESSGYGPGSNRDETTNRPYGAMTAQNQYSGTYNVDFIGPDTSPTIYLTYDEGYEYGYTSSILDILSEKGVSATFFCTYNFLRDNSELVQRMINEGHTIGNHTKSHPSAGMPSLSLQEQYDDITFVEDYVRDTYGYEMTLFRFPSGIYSEQSLALLTSMGYSSVFWSFAYVDWVTDDQPDPTESLNKLLSTLHNGEIVLLHAESSTNLTILSDFIDGARAAGFEFGVYPTNGF